MSAQDWTKFFKQFPSKTISCGDFNAHHIEWGSNRSCKAGNNIKEGIDNLDLLILNKQTVTHHSSAHKTWDSIDISISHISLGLTIEWSISTDSWGSDHLPIFLQVGCHTSLYNPYPHSNRIQSKNIDWKLFNARIWSSIEDLKDTLSSIDDPTIKYSSFTAIITDALSPPPKTQNTQRFSPSSSNKDASRQPSRSPPCEWWDAECDRWARLRKAMWLKYRHSNLACDFIEYKKASAKARILFRNKKRDKFRDFCNNLRKDTNPSYIWRKVKTFKNRWEGGCNSHEFSGDSMAAIENLINEISPPSANPPRPDFDYSAPDSFLDLSFSKEKLNFAIHSGKHSSAPGPDGIDYQAIRNLPDNALVILLELYNDFYKNQTVPKEWNHYSMSFIPKKGNLKFRPISLASCICKILERMVCFRLFWWLEHHGLLSNSQFGFRRNRSCLDNIAILHTDIANSFIEKKATCALFLDIEKAFDNVNIDILIQKT